MKTRPVFKRAWQGLSDKRVTQWVKPCGYAENVIFSSNDSTKSSQLTVTLEIWHTGQTESLSERGYYHASTVSKQLNG